MVQSFAEDILQTLQKNLLEQDYSREQLKKANLHESISHFLQNTLDTQGSKTFEGNLLLGGDGNVPTKIEITSGSCTKPSGDIVNYKVKLTFATDVYNGCAESM